MNQKPGILFLIPTPLGEDTLAGISPELLEVVFALDYFIVERGKTARRFLKAIPFPRPLQSLEFQELNEHTPDAALEGLLAPVLAGRDAGLMSEAGCPAVADPGSPLVLLAHRMGIEVRPLVGPSSILLALMASGLNGQRFCFHGYLTAKKMDLGRQIRQLEMQSAKERQTQIFIETPYRSQAMLEMLIRTLSPGSWLSVSAGLTLPSQYIRTQTAAKWKALHPLPDLNKQPAVFLILAV
ncbi:MAG: SAM-dependent methyltransferase [Haliscomenobacter sp.]|nr:SAM-dependent methyltransferase [Haliscomenobacter sp.]MBK7475983.1 SAM-dependent methyltransferase [Haliscomenobacter sp.]MBK8877940.1 SAM-dependent methyltransferase [Haliscomenobacter sp.]